MKNYLKKFKILKKIKKTRGQVANVFGVYEGYRM